MPCLYVESSNDYWQRNMEQIINFTLSAVSKNSDALTHFQTTLDLSTLFWYISFQAGVGRMVAFAMANEESPNSVEHGAG